MDSLADCMKHKNYCITFHNHMVNSAKTQLKHPIVVGIFPPFPFPLRRYAPLCVGHVNTLQPSLARFKSYSSDRQQGW